MGKETKLSLIVAYNNNRVIGKDNKLLWKLSNDLRNVKKLTTNNAIVMGRKTYESLGKPLPNRINIVLTTDKEYSKKVKGEDILVVNSREEVLKKVKELEVSIVYIFGGEEVYKMFLEEVDELRITIVDNNLLGDTKFPNFNEEEYTLKQVKYFSKDRDNEYNHKFKHYIRK